MANETQPTNDTAVSNISIDVVELTEEDMNEAMAGMGVKPEDVTDPAERTSYEYYLSKLNAKP